MGGCGKKFFRKYFDIRCFTQEQQKHFFFNLALGILVMLFFIMLENTSWGQAVINDWFDAYIALRTGENTAARRAAEQIVFLEFDDRSMKEMGRPDITPRDKVAELAEAAYQGGAKLIVLDMNFAEPDYSPERQAAGDAASMDGRTRDQKLFTVLQQIQQGDTGTRLLLPMMAYADHTMQPNIFASLVDNKNIYFVTPAFTSGRGNDKQVRFWMPYLKMQDAATGEEKVVWSIPMMSLAIVDAGMEQMSGLAKKLLDEVPGHYSLELRDAGRDRSFVFHREEMEGKGIIRDAESHQYNRIQYAVVPRELSQSYFAASVSLRNLGHWRKDGIDNQGIDYRNKIVVIGRSDQDCADFSGTPVGDMPGMYIHANSIATVLGEPHPHLTPMYKHVIIELVLIVLAAYAFLHLHTIVAKLALGILFVVCWICSYLYFCWTSEFVNLSFSFMGIGIHDLVSRMEALFEAESKK